MRSPLRILTALPGRNAAFGAVGLVAVLGAGGAAYAATGTAATTNPPPNAPGTVQLPDASTAATGAPASGPASGPAARRRARSLLARSDHAVLEIRVKGQWVTYSYDRGSVTAVSPSSITLERPDGQSVTESISPSTRYRGVSSETALRIASPAVVVSEGGTAVRIAQRPASGSSSPTA